MARCGCSGTTCNCVVQAGANVTVTGTGASGDPYIVSANDSAVDVLDSPSINFTLIPGAPDIITGVVLLDPAAGNLISLAAGGLRVDCATITATCAIGVAVTDTDTVNLTLGPGNNISADVLIDSTTPGNLITVVPGGTPGGLRVDCQALFDNQCFDTGLGIDEAAFDAGGLIQVCLSGDGGNVLAFGTDGCLYSSGSSTLPVTVTDTTTIDLTLVGQDISADAIIDPNPLNLLDQTPTTGLLATLATDCGLIGAGTLANPVRANVHATFEDAAGDDFACGVASGSNIFCDPGTGELKGEPEKFFLSTKVDQPVCNSTCLFNSLDAVGGGAVQVGLATVFNITNPDPCRAMTLEVTGGIQHALIAQPPGSGNGRMDAELAAGVTLAGGGVTATTAVQNGHQHWAHSDDANSGRASFDSKGSFGITYYSLPAGATTTVTMVASFENIQNSGGVQAEVSGWSNTVVIKGWSA